MSGDNIVVAIRVRGFNEREKEMNSKLCVSMYGPQTTLLGNDDLLSKEPPKRDFAFDYSYWSFDGFSEEESGYLAPDSPTSQYADQSKIYKDLGNDILKNALSGYNCGLFAYGQTGAGKSFSIFGTPANKGLVPNFCEELFETISQKNIQFEVTLSMIEIYSEQVRDLLNPIANAKGLSVHERPGKGFHIMEKDMRPVQVLNYAAIEKLIQKGNKKKATAATSMNSVSSRAHTIVQLVFKQVFKNETGSLMQRESIINLIDLAGSERLSKSQTSGQQFKEGIAINLSLTTLGNCISVLCQKSEYPNIRVPYRESNLTKLLMNTLGGNSKTVMIAAISPSEDNYAESLSTLRYADRAKQIKCNAMINEDPKDRIILSLQEEIARLKSMMEGGNEVGSQIAIDVGEYERQKREMAESMKKQIEENEQYIADMKRSYESKLAEAEKKALEMDEKLCAYRRSERLKKNMRVSSEAPARAKSMRTQMKDKSSEKISKDAEENATGSDGIAPITSALDKHTRSHTGEKPYSCDVCEMRFHHKISLDKHALTHTGEKPFCCSICQKRFARKDALDTHTRTHTGEKPYGCEVCEMRFAHKSALDRHTLTHTGEKSFRCSVCPKTFAVKKTLCIHTRTHTGEKPYGCDVCEMRFRQKSHLVVHTRIHTGEKPHVCDVCKMRFSQKSTLKKHARIHAHT